MAFNPGRPADPTEIALVSPTALTASFVATPDWSVVGWDEVDLTMYVTHRGAGPISRIDVEFDYSTKAAPGADDWAPLQVESVTASTGISVPATYDVQQGALPATPFPRSWTAKVRGARMRARVRAGTGDPAGSAITLAYLRR